MDEYCERLTLLPGALSVLKRLRRQGIITVVLSTHPHTKEEAYVIIRHKVRYFRLEALFDEVHATREYHASKGEYMVRILKQRGIPKDQALMVGDKYRWEYTPARDVGIDAVLMRSDYLKNDTQGRRIRRTERSATVCIVRCNFRRHRTI